MLFNQSLLNSCPEKHHTVSLNTSGIGTKKKRKLLSKKLMNTPCGKLISPHIKRKEEESGYFAKETEKVLGSLGKIFVRCSLQSNSNFSYTGQKKTIIDSVTPSFPFSSCPKEPAEDAQKQQFCMSFDESDSDQSSPNLFVTSKPLEGTLIFVDVRAENENRSKAISQELGKLGAEIGGKISNQVTHVVYEDGRQSTLTQMKKYPHIHFVSVLGVDSCKTTKCKVNESLVKAKLP